MRIDKIITQVNYNFQRHVDDFDSAIKMNLSLLLKYMKVDRASIYLVEDKENMLYPKVIVTACGESDEGIISICANSDNDYCRALEKRNIIVTGYPSYALYMPLINDNSRLGILRLDNYLNNSKITIKQAKEMRQLMPAFQQGVNNCLVYDRFHAQIKKLTTLTKLAGVMATAMRIEEILKIALHSLVKDMGYDRAHVFLLNESAESVTQRFSFDFRGSFKSHGQSSGIYLTDDCFLKETAPSFLSKKFSLDTIAYTPIFWKSSKIGVLVVDNLFSQVLLKEDDRSFLGILTNQLGVLIANSRLFEKVEKSSVTDGLTGLFNHRHFYERLQQEISRSYRSGKKLSVIMCDLDHFKRFNDNYGHQTGDTTLKATADLVRKNVRIYDIAARYGGEEFAIILPGAGAEDAKIIANRIRDDLKRCGAMSGRKTLKITISVGIATYPDNSQEKMDLVRKADKALYCAKEHGRDRIVHFEDIP